MELFLTGNGWPWRLSRTVVQGVLGGRGGQPDLIVGCAVTEPTWRAVVVVLVMAVLSSVMAGLGALTAEKEAAMCGAVAAEFADVASVEPTSKC